MVASIQIVKGVIMKDKLYFLFCRKTGHQELAVLLSDIAYKILMIYYYIARCFSKKIVSMEYQEAYDILERKHKEPKEAYDAMRKEEKDETIDLSIIIPVYNVGSFLKECLDSVFNQKTTYQYEVIAVNDGSTDNSLEILEGYCEKENYRIINQDNGGLSNARNTGINYARGKNYFFLDSDDVITLNCVQAMLDIMYQCDAEIVQGRYYSFQAGIENKYYSKEPAAIYEKREIPIEEYPGFAWGKVYRAELFEGIRFPEGVWFEDTIVQYLLFGRCKKFVCTEEVCYGYRKNPNSISFSAKKDLKCLDTYWVTKKMIEKASEDKNISQEYIYKLTLRQYSLIMYNRLHWIEPELLETVFAVVCEDLKRMKNENFHMEGIYKQIEEAFNSKNIKLWKLCSTVL